MAAEGEVVVDELELAFRGDKPVSHVTVRVADDPVEERRPVSLHGWHDQVLHPDQRGDLPSEKFADGRGAPVLPALARIPFSRVSVTGEKRRTVATERDR